MKRPRTAEELEPVNTDLVPAEEPLVLVTPELAEALASADEDDGDGVGEGGAGVPSHKGICALTRRRACASFTARSLTG